MVGVDGGALVTAGGDEGDGGGAALPEGMGDCCAADVEVSTALLVGAALPERPSCAWSWSKKVDES